MSVSVRSLAGPRGQFQACRPESDIGALNGEKVQAEVGDIRFVVGLGLVFKTLDFKDGRNVDRRYKYVRSGVRFPIGQIRIRGPHARSNPKSHP